MKLRNTIQTKAFLELYLKLKDVQDLLSYQFFFIFLFLFFIFLRCRMSVQMCIVAACCSACMLFVPFYSVVIKCRRISLRLREEYNTQEETSSVCFNTENAVLIIPGKKCEVTVDYQNIVNFYKLRHYYFLLIVTEQTIPVFMDREEMSGEQEDKLNTFIMQRAPHLQYQKRKTVKENFDFYKLNSEGDLYGI